MPYERSLERAPEGRPTLDRGSLDPWGLPPSSASRRDTEEMLSRVSRTEAESSEAYRRIEEHLRTVQRRLDSAERSQSENNRAMNKTATEINIATREQAQAFDQLGGHVMSIGDRLERLERNTAQDGIKDAVKALHQGLSRLADQITQTATQSAQQVSSISGNLEQLAGRLGQVRNEVEATAQRLEMRVTAAEEETRNRFAAAEEEARNRFAAAREETRSRFAAFEAETARTLDQRLAAVEKASHFNTNALDHALERLEVHAGIRAGDQAELQKRLAGTDGAIGRLEESVERLDARSADPTLERRLDGIERALGSLVSRLETQDPAAALEDAMRGFARRIDTVEKNQDALLDELHANLTSSSEPAVAAPEPGFDPTHLRAKRFCAKMIHPPKGILTARTLREPKTRFEAPPFAEPVPPADSEPPPLHDQDPFAADSFATGAFTAPPEDVTAADENFLAAARRAARAAAEAEAARGTKLGLSWAPSRTKSETAERPRYLVPAILAGILVVALAAALVLSQKFKSGNSSSSTGAPAQHVAHNNAPFTPAPQTLPSPQGTQALNLPLQQPPARPAPIHSAPAAAIPAPPTPSVQAPQQPQAKGPAPTLDRVTQLANGGNAIAQTIIGLKELDGDGVPANPVDADKWLERAANQGQAVAQYRLGTAYERGQGVTANPATATHWYQLAANQGNRNAMHNLAVAYASGATGKKDMAEAARWFAKAAALGLPDSQFNLAVLYERGDGVPQSLLDAYKWYAIASGQGDAESKSRLAVLGSQLSDDDRATAQKSAATFRPAPLSRAANVPPEMADLSGN